MLVLSRDRHEELVIGRGVNQVIVRVVEIRGGHVRLGVIAPQEIPVHRRETYDAIVLAGGTVTSAAMPKDPPATPSAEAAS